MAMNEPMQQQIDPRLQQGLQPGSPDIAAGVPQGDTLTAQSLMQKMNPQALGLLQQQLQQNQQAPQSPPPAYDQTIQTILGSIQALTQQWGGGEGLNTDVFSKGVHALAQSAYFLADAAQKEGEHIPANIQVRVQAAQLDMQYEKQQQELQMQAQQQQHDQQLQREKHAMELQLMQHQALMQEHEHDTTLQQQQQAHQQDMQQQQQQQAIQAQQAQQQMELAQQQQQNQGRNEE